MITPKEIENKTMNESKRAEAKISFFAYYIGRPLSYIFTIPLLYTNIKPNAITIISIIFLVLGYLFFSFGRGMHDYLIGLFMIFLWNMGDGIDGNIARYKNITSENGDLLDTLGGYLAICIILLGMGNVAYSDYLGHIYFNAKLPIVVSGVSAVATIIPRALMHREMAKSNTAHGTVLLKDKKNYSIAKILVLNLCDPAGFQEVMMLIAICFHLATEFTLFYCALNILIMIYSIKKMMIRQAI